MATNARTKTAAKVLMIPFVAAKCGRIGHRSWRKTEVSWLARMFLNFNLFGGLDGLRTYIGFTRIRRSDESSWSSHVEHLGKSRFCILRGPGLGRRCICATRRLGGSGKCSNPDHGSRGEMLPK
jgi:hypothetical protein